MNIFPDSENTGNLLPTHGKLCTFKSMDDHFDLHSEFFSLGTSRSWDEVIPLDSIVCRIAVEDFGDAIEGSCRGILSSVFLRSSLEYVPELGSYESAICIRC